MALIKRYPEEKLDHIDLKQSCWAQSLFRRMGFVRRLGTTGKIPIPDSLKKELEKSYLHGIVKKIEDNDISQSLVLNLDQTPSKYIPVLNKTMAPKGSKTVPIKGSTEKRIITTTFTYQLSTFKDNNNNSWWSFLTSATYLWRKKPQNVFQELIFLNRF